MSESDDWMNLELQNVTVHCEALGRATNSFSELQITPFCIIQADSKVLELILKIAKLQNKVKSYMLCYDNALLIC